MPVSVPASFHIRYTWLRRSSDVSAPQFTRATLSKRRKPSGPNRATFKPRPFPNPSPQPTFKDNRQDEPKIRVFDTVRQLRPFRHAIEARGRSVGLVPTMGALHEGHLTLARRAAEENQDVFVSIYVNPTQFGVNEDLASYPRTFDTDMQKLQTLNEELRVSNYHGRVTAVFAPPTREMYPTLPPTSELNGKGSFVLITPLGELLEGASRPVFFRGVATVCMKLFNIVNPTRVYFGQKDVQQTAIIKRLVTDFHLNTMVRIIPTERDPDGLAMSSRNVYLGARRRAVAVTLPRALQLAEQMYLGGQLHRDRILDPARDFVRAEVAAQQGLAESERALMELDYISLADPETMEEVEMVEAGKGAVLSAALRMLPVESPVEGEDTGESGGGGRVVRLIDNIILPPAQVPK